MRGQERMMRIRFPLRGLGFSREGVCTSLEIGYQNTSFIVRKKIQLQHGGAYYETDNRKEYACHEQGEPSFEHQTRQTQRSYHSLGYAQYGSWSPRMYIGFVGATF